MPYIHDTPRESPVPQEVTEESLIPEERILRAFYANTFPTPDLLEISCTMYVTRDKAGPLEYDMRVVINKPYAPPRVQWLRPLGHVKVSYFTERADTPVAVRRYPLAFYDNRQMEVSFHANMHEVRWEEFLIVGVEFPVNTIHYTLDTADNRLLQRIRRRTMRTVQKVHLKTYLNRDPIIGREDSSIYTRTLTSESGLSSTSDSSSNPGSVRIESPNSEV